MALNFNIEPFYDDYDETKKFYRILFRPGYAVQARELTQLQTILQQQIKRHGDHMFKNGAMIVPGQISYDANTSYVKLQENVTGSTSVKTFSILSNITGKIYENTNGVQAIILTSTPKEVVNNVSEYDTIFVKYIRGTGTFAAGDILSPVDGTPGLNLTVEAPVNNPIGQGVTATIQQGIYYIKNHFVFVEQQTKVVSKYSTVASAKIGLQVNESVVYPEDDESLLDNALGSPNYAAPGAARYYIDLVLTSKSYGTVVDSEEFITLLTLKDGNVQFLVDRTQYAQIEKTLARRTFDESGDYTVREFPIQIRDYRNNDRGAWALSTFYIKGDIVTSGGKTYKCIANHQSANSGNFAETTNWLEDNTPVYNYGLYQGLTTSGNLDNDIVPLKNKISLAVEPGKAYVRGYEIEKIATQYLILDKARGESHISPTVSRTVDTSPGNYVILSSVNALPDINTDVVFYDRYGAAGTVPGSGVVVATARVKQIQMHTLSPLTYKVFLFNMSVASGKVFSRDAKFVYSTTGQSAGTRFSGIIAPTRIQLPGTLNVSTTSITVTGVNTTFTADLKVGDYVSISGSEYRVETIASNNSITINTAVSITAGTLIYRVEATINEPNLIDAYYRIPQYSTNSTSNFRYSFYKRVTTEPGTSTTINENTYSLGVATDDKNFIVVNSVSGAHLTKVASNATLASGQYKITSSTSSAISFEFNPSGTYNIIYCVEKDAGSSTPINKTLTNILDETVTLTNGVAVLTEADGYELQKVTSTVTVGQTTTVTDVTSKFSFDTGVRSSHYDLASISLLPGEVAPTGTIKVTYSHFEHATGDYYAVNSYTHSGSKIEYDELSSDQINLVDFRPLRASDGTFSGCKIPKYGEETTFQYNYYLGRIDKLSLSTSGDFIITKGIPDSIPSVPPSPKDSMDLYTFNIEPYTFKGSTASVVPYKIENKRYTMRDIGRLESRINNLEYYATLSLLEQNTLGSKSYDSYGLERPQNGFIVDDFTGQGVGLSSSLDWQASVDIKAGELRPFFKTTNIALLEEIGATLDRSSKNYEINGDLITLKITSKTPLVSQLRASHSESVNPFNIFVFNGSLEITPWNDTWYETQRRPDIIINDTSQYDAVVAKAEKDGVLGTVYKSWSTNWIGETVTGTQTHVGDRRWGDGGAWLDQTFGIGPENVGWARREVTVETFARTGTKTYTGGVKTFIQSNVTDKVIEDKVVSTELIPYMRSRKILFRGDSLKPDTRMYAFFDGINVDTHITPAKIMTFTPYGTTTIPTFATSVNVGSNINSEARKTAEGDVSSAYTYGEVLKQYYIAQGSQTPVDDNVTCVVVGQETYKGNNYVYIDNIKGGTISDAVVTVNGVQRTYYLQAEFDSNRKIQKVGNIVTPTNLTTTKTGQLFGTYTIPNGTSMSFRTGTKLLRFSDNASNIRANAATSAEAEYTAKGIIEIKERTILSTKTASVVSERVPDRTESVTTTGSRVSGDTGWYDPLAQTFLVDIEGGAFITDVDLFFAQVDENLPIKIQIRNVVNGYPGPMVIPFSEVILQPSQVNVHNKGALATNFKFRSPIYLQNGVEYALVVISDSAKYRVWISEAGQADVDGSGLISQQPYAGVLFKSQNASTWTAEQNQDLKFRINRAVFNTSGTATVSLINQHVNADTFYDVANVSVNKIVLPGTSLSATLNNVNGTVDNNISIPLDQDIEFTQQQKLKDKDEENGTASFKTTIVMSSTKDNVSPVLDVSRCSTTLVSNIIENSSSDGEQYPEIGTAKAKYITKQIKLNQPSTNLRILFDSNVPSNAAVKVYYKTGLQGTNFSNAEFSEVTAFTKPIRKLENARQFTESEINLQVNPFDIVQVKLVMKSSNTAKVPRVKALRVIAYA